MPSSGPDEESTAAGIYGVIVGAAVMATADAARATTLAIGVLFTLIVYWTAERYARLVAARVHGGHRPSRDQVRRELTRGWPIVSASAVPLAVLVLTTLLGADVSTAALAALICSSLLLCLAGWEVGRGALGRTERAASAIVAGLLGVGMILLKSLLH